MASANGNRVGHWWANVNAWVVSENATQATIRVECRFQSDPWGYNVWAGNSTSVTCDGQTSGTQGYGTINVGYGVAANVLTISRDFTVAKAAGGRNVWCTATFTLGGYEPGTSSAGVNVWTNGISYSAPTSPSNLTAAYVSDTSADLTWTNGGTSVTQPRSATLIEVRTDGGSWIQVASASADAPNYTYGSLSANHMYEFRIRAQGAGGYSGYATAPNPVYTTPASPSSVSVSKSSASVVTLSIDGAAPYAESYDIERSINSGTSWEAAGSAQSFPWNDTSAPAGTVVYRVRAVRGDLASAWAESNSITTITPPLAPTVTIAGGASVVPTGQQIPVSWVPNHPDNSDQTQAQVEVTVGSAEPQTYAVPGAATSYTVAAQAAATTVRVRVRTHGLDPDWGAWSSYAQVNVAVAPTGYFSSPESDGTVIDAVPIDVSWSITDVTGVSAQTLSLLDSGGRSLWSSPLGPSVRSYRLTEAEYEFANFTGYSLRLTATMGSGLVLTIARSFDTDWAGPAEPSVTINYGDDMSATLIVSDGDDGESPEAVSFSVTRVLPDGSQQIIASGITNYEAARDPLPPLNTEYLYIVTAYAETGATTQKTFPAMCDSGGMEVFNYRADASGALVLGFDATSSMSPSHSGTTFHFALGPDAPHLPTFYPDGDMDVSGSKSYVLYGREGYQNVLSVCRDPDNSVFWYRDAWGGRYRVVSEFSISYDAKQYMRFDVSARITEVVWEDPL